MKKITTLLAAFFALVTVATAQKKIDLKFNPPIGKKFVFVINADMTMDMGQMPGADSSAASIKMDMKMMMEMGYVVNKKTSDTIYAIETTYDRVALDANMGMLGKSLSFDSDKPVDTTDKEMAMASRIFGAITGTTLKMEVTQKGDVVSFTGMEEIVNKMIEKIGVPVDGPQMDALRKQLSNEKYAKQNMNYFNIYPDKPVSVGDVWAVSQTHEAFGRSVNVESKYTLKEIKDGKAYVDVSNVTSAGKASQPASDDQPAADDAGSALDNMKAKQTGTVVYDVKTGLPLSMKIAMEVETVSSINPGKISTMLMNLDMTTRMQ